MGGSELGDTARGGDLIIIPALLEEMAVRLAEMPFAVKAAADTAAVIDALREANVLAFVSVLAWPAVVLVAALVVRSALPKPPRSRRRCVQVIRKGTGR